MHYYWPREPQGRELENLTQLFKILGDPSRMKVLFQIGPSEACVSEVADKLNMSESAVSHHIHILRMNGLVRWCRSGKAIYYVLKRLFSLRIIRNCWMNMTEMTEFVL